MANYSMKDYEAELLAEEREKAEAKRNFLPNTIKNYAALARTGDADLMKGYGIGTLLGYLLSNRSEKDAPIQGLATETKDPTLGSAVANYNNLVPSGETITPGGMPTSATIGGTDANTFLNVDLNKMNVANALGGVRLENNLAAPANFNNYAKLTGSMENPYQLPKSDELKALQNMDANTLGQNLSLINGNYGYSPTDTAQAWELFKKEHNIL